MRALLIILFSALLPSGASAHVAHVFAPSNQRGPASCAVASTAVAEGTARETIVSGNSGAEHRFRKLLHRVLRPEGTHERVDTNALLALIFGVVGLVSLSFFPLLILLSIPALILGISGLKRVKRDGTKGKGLAIAGIVLGGLGILMMLAGVVGAILIVALWLK